MERTSPLQVRVRGRRQITLPAAVVRTLNIGENDVLNVTAQEGTITLTTQQAVQKKRRSLMDLAGSTPGLYGNTTEEIHTYIANERASWER